MERDPEQSEPRSGSQTSIPAGVPAPSDAPVRDTGGETESSPEAEGTDELLRIWPPQPGRGAELGLAELGPPGEHPAPDHALRFAVVHEERRYAIIEKPAGMLSVPGHGADKRHSVATLARSVFTRATGPMICHRLDMATSGLMVLALDPDAHRFLSNQFERRRVDKAYSGVARGHVPEDAGTIQLPLRERWASRPRRIVDFVEGREAITRFGVDARTVDRRGGPVTRLRLEPVTGRTHQLRVHLAAPREVGERLTGRSGVPGGLGSPLVGDGLYGDETPGSGRLLLHACRLGFADPATLRPVVFESEAPF